MAIPAFPLEAPLLEPRRMEASTKSCAAFGHPELVVEWDPERTARADVERLLSTFEAAVAAGERFAPGSDVRVGTFGLRLVRAAPGTIALVEPDLAGPPGTFRRGVDGTLTHLRAQQEMSEALGLSPAFPSLDDRARVCSHLTGARQLVLDRAAARHPGDSGLFVGCGRELDAETAETAVLDVHPLEVLTVREVVTRWPATIPFVAVPPGTTVVCVGRDEALVFRDDREVAVRLLATSPRSMRVPRAPLARCLA